MTLLGATDNKEDIEKEKKAKKAELKAEKNNKRNMNLIKYLINK